MAYRMDEETDAVREYDMINTLFNGDEEEQARLKDVEDESACDCPPAGEGIAYRIFKFIFGEHEIDQLECCESYDEKRPYHRHIHTPAHSVHPGALGPGNNENSNRRRWTYRRPYSLVTRNMSMPGPEGPPGRAVHTETLLRLIATIVCAMAVIVFSTTSVTLRRFKDWILSI